MVRAVMRFPAMCAQVAWETKAEDILVLHVAPVVYWTRYMLICTVYSRPQLNAILGKMVKEAEQEHGRTLSVNPTANRCAPGSTAGQGGRAAASWPLLGAHFKLPARL